MPTALAYAAALLFGLVLVTRIFPGSALDGSISLLHPPSGDPAQHIAGQRFFLADSWRWPPLLTELVDPPRGVNIGLTDSIPLAALLAKPFTDLLPRGGHLVYAWVALCYLLQPVAAIWALRGAGERRALPCIGGAMLAGCMPTLIFRFGHPALCGHFLLLIAIGVYFRMVARPAGLWWLAGLLVTVASLLVHPYLAAMTFGLLLGAPLSLLARAEWRAALLTGAELGVGLLLLGVVAAVGGYLGAELQSGFGFYSLNLLSPVLPVGTSLLPGYPMMDATGGQYEGYAYLGLGGLGLAALAASQAWRPAAWRLLGRHAGLVLVAMGALLFAVSDQVYAGHHLVARLPEAPAALRQFRASGRFVWVDTYILVIAAAALPGRFIRPVPLAALLLALAGLQYADTRTLRGQVAAQLAAPTAWQADPAFFRPLLARHGRLTLWPTAACQPEMVSNRLFTDLLLLASEQGMVVNTIPTARATAGDACTMEPLLRPQLARGELRLILPGAASQVARIPALRAVCHELPLGIVGCSEDPSLTALPTVPEPAFTPGRDLSLGEPEGARLADTGWTAASPDGAWTIGGAAVLLGAAPGPGTFRLRMLAHGLARPGQAQAVVLSANGAELARWAVTPGADREYEAVLPPGIAPGGELRLTLAIPNPLRPQDVMGNGDTRPLGFFLRRLRLDPA